VAKRHLNRTVAQDVDATFDEHAVRVNGPEHEAAGVKAVMVSMQRALVQMGPTRMTAALARVNQRHGFDCPGCAWPEAPGGRKIAEFCENGAKAVAEEATKRTVTPEFFARHSVSELAARPEYWRAPSVVVMNGATLMPTTFGRGRASNQGGPIFPKRSVPARP